MDTYRWQVLQEQFAQARGAAPDERAHIIAELARTDAGLAAELVSLLDTDSKAGPMDALAGRIAPVSHVFDKRPASTPARVGAYRIVGELGRGGMGTVYHAERADGHFEQRVAIKLIDETSDDDPHHRRFLAERQILAGLVHPNIARLLDGGVAEDGRPYIVMEYVDGLPITEWCDQQRLSLRARLRLFCDVCAAVQYAHQKLVIHRDIKPSNILVARDGRVHLLDFGIAQLIDPDAAGPNEGHEVRALTPEYASPEQVRGLALTTASDIYSLGVLLYGLLTGRFPYDVPRDSLAGMIAAICELQPESPSTRAARGDVEAALRGTTADRLARDLRGDIDGIVAMALRKEPERRYASADMLREDLERHMAGQPVVAHHGGWRYRAGKFVRRHRVEVAAVSLMFGGLMAGLTTAVFQGRRADRERVRAEQALAQSEGVTDFMLELFRSGDADDTLSAPGLTALDLLHRGAARAYTLAEQPAVQARLLDVVGQMSLHLGQLNEAQRLLEQAVAIRRANNDVPTDQLATSLIHLAWVHRARNEIELARTLVAEALRLRQVSLEADHPDVAEALYEMGWLNGGPRQEQLYRQAIAILPDTGAFAARRLTVLQALSTNLRRQGRLDETVTTSREAVRVAEAAFGADHHLTGDAMIHLGDHVRDIEQDPTEAERLFRRGLELIEHRYGEQSIRLIHGLHSLGTLLSARGDAGAEQVFRRAIVIRQSATGPGHPQVAEGWQYLAGELARQGRLAEAESLQRQAVAHSVKTLGERHPVISSQRLPKLAMIVAHQGRLAEADAIFESAIGRGTASLVSQGEVLRDYGLFLLERGDFDRAELLLLRSLEMLGQHYAGEPHPNLQESKRALMSLYSRWGKAELVERYRVPPGRYVAY